METKLSPQPGKKPALSQSNTIIGLLFIMAGIIGFSMNLFNISLENWWALFIFLPAGGTLLLGRTILQKSSGRHQFIGRLFVGVSLILTLDAVMFLLNLNWSHWWPLTLVSSGAALVILGWETADANQSPARYVLLSLCRSLGFSVMLLGVVFLFNQVGSWTLGGRFATWQWWGIFLLLPAIGTWINGRQVYAANEFQTNAAVMLLNGISLTLAVLGSAELVHLNWRLANNGVGMGLILFGILVLIRSRKKASLF